MARVKEGIFGGFSGRISNVVGCKGKNGFYVRSRPVHINNPRTEQQQAHRGKFAEAMRFACTLTPFLRISYREFAGAGQPFHAAVSSILKNALVETDAGYAIDFGKALVSRGSLTSVHRAEVTRADDMVTYTWTDNSGEGNATSSDVALLVTFNKTRYVAVYSDSTVCRSDEMAELGIPADWNNDELAVYLGFRSVDGETVANSICLWNSITACVR